MGKIADISKWQGSIDWDKAAKELDLVILRVQDGASYADPRFREYAAACEKRGIPYGVYGFFRAWNITGAVTEADKLLARCKGFSPLFYVADVEVLTTATSERLAPVVKAFFDRLGDLKKGLYISTALYPHVYRSDADFIWIPRYGLNDGTANLKYQPKYPCDLWQYTSVGRVAGISGNVDLNILHGDKKLDWFTGKEDAPADPAPPPAVLTSVRAGKLCGPYNRPVYRYPGNAGKVMGTLRPGQEVRLLADHGDYWNIRRGPIGPFGFAGYIHKKYIIERTY